MSAEKNINILTAIFRLTFAIVNGVVRLTITFLMLIPRLWSRALTIAVKIGLVFKLIFEPLARMLGSLLAGIWRAIAEAVGAWRQRKNEGESRGNN